MNAHITWKLGLLAALMATQTALAASSAIKPVPMQPGDRCHGCNREILDRYVAVETIGEHGSTPSKFRSIRCMLSHLNETGVEDTKIYVADDQTGKLISVDDAVFVPVAIAEFTGVPEYGIGETDYVAFKSAKVAERFAARHGVTTMSWPAVRFYAAFLPATATEGH